MRNQKWHRFLGRFHVYGGLLTAGFLIAFSYSAFYHQHHLKFPKPGSKTVQWEQQLTIADIPDNPDKLDALDYKLAVRDSLGLFGHAPWWKDYRDSLEIHHFMIARPGKQYWITVPGRGNIYQVDEIRTGFWKVLIQLHPLSGGMSGHGKEPFFISTWKIVSLLMSLVLLGVMLISIHYWYIRSFSKRRSWFIVGAMFLFPVILMVFIWLVG
jgi:hypothetical protein